MKHTVVVFVAGMLAPAGVHAAAPQDAPVAIGAGSAAVAWGACPAIFPEGCELAVLHGDPTQPNADLLLRVQPGVHLPAHSHTSVERMVLTAGRMTVKYDGAPEVLLEAGSYLWGPAGTAHRARCVSDSACVLFIAFERPVDAVPFAGVLR